MRRALAAVALLAGCQPADPVANTSGGAGAALERAALAAGLVADAQNPAGLYASETDRLCIVPAGDGYRIGAITQFVDGPGCSAHGNASRVGRDGRMTVRFGEDCQFDARSEGDRITFPATLPAACDASCRGRASFAALSAERASASIAEAAAMRDRAGITPCAS